MCDEIKFPILPGRGWSLGSCRGKFSPSCASPAAFNSLLIDADFYGLCQYFDNMEESFHAVIPVCTDIFDNVFEVSAADDCASVTEDSMSSDNDAGPATCTNSVYPALPMASLTTQVSDNRRCAIAKWKVKKSRQKRLTKVVCKARSEVALSRPRVKGKFIKKAQFIPVTELQAC